MTRQILRVRERFEVIRIHARAASHSGERQTRIYGRTDYACPCDPPWTIDQTIIPHITAHPAAGMNANTPAPATAKTMVSAAKTPQISICEDFISSSSSSSKVPRPDGSPTVDFVHPCFADCFVSSNYCFGVPNRDLAAWGRSGRPPRAAHLLVEERRVADAVVHQVDVGPENEGGVGVTKPLAHSWLHDQPLPSCCRRGSHSGSLDPASHSAASR